ncbi:MAG TPA: M48 family metalloprotease [Humisphaera sp.]
MPLRPIRPTMLILLATAASFAAGCGSSRPVASAPSAVDRWVDRQGGMLACPDRQARLDRAVAALGRPDLTCLRTYVLGTDRPAAYSWPDGRVFVSRGLVDLLDDAELAAAIAHECGHLIADGHVAATPPTALTGKPAHACGGDAEVAADREGVALLRAANIDPAALARVLAKLGADARLDAGIRQQVRERAELLHDIR